MHLARSVLLALLVAVLFLPAAQAEVVSRSYALPQGGGHPHDVAVDADGIAWYTAQRHGALGRLDPATGKVDLIPLGVGAAPHGVIIGPDGAPWVTEGASIPARWSTRGPRAGSSGHARPWTRSS